jgi:hypothetical protein
MSIWQELETNIHKSNKYFLLIEMLIIFAPPKKKLINTIYCGVEQLVARWAHNPKVIGSSPVPATKKASQK